MLQSFRILLPAFHSLFQMNLRRKSLDDGHPPAESVVVGGPSEGGEEEMDSGKTEGKTWED